MSVAGLILLGLVTAVIVNTVKVSRQSKRIKKLEQGSDKK